MTDWPLITAGLLALCWGIAWALFLQFHPRGRWLVVRRTWITVVIGIGVDLLLLCIAFPLADVLRILLVIALSAVGLITRSLHNEQAEDAD